MGTYSGKIQIWDAVKNVCIRTMGGHLSRVGVSAWNNSMVCSGSRDRTIMMRDIRSPDDYISQLYGH